MKTKLFATIGMIVIAFHVYAQNPSTTPQMPSSATNMMQNVPNGIGSILSTLENGIDPSALTSKFAGQKSSWLSKASALGSTDVKGASGLLSQLIGGIKPASFNSGVKPADLMSQVKDAGSMSDLGNSITSLISGLNPSALTKDFAANKDSFLKSLSTLSTMK